jgi:hypothetical protein
MNRRNGGDSNNVRKDGFLKKMLVIRTEALVQRLHYTETQKMPRKCATTTRQPLVIASTLPARTSRHLGHARRPRFSARAGRWPGGFAAAAYPFLVSSGAAGHQLGEVVTRIAPAALPTAGCRRLLARTGERFG